MAIYPGAEYRPVAHKGRRRLTEYNRVNVHVAVSEASSLFGYMNKPRNPDSHFYVRRDGTVEQYVNTIYRANADLEGNDATISIETQGGTKNVNSEQFTHAQVVTIAKIFVWAHQAHGVPMRLAKDSKIGPSSHGLSWHRLGIDGNFPPLPSVLAGRNQRGGGMYYSRSRGKVCPGDAKIKQVVGEIFATAKKYLADAKPTTPPDLPVHPSKGIATDGWWGPATTGLAQKILGRKVDKKVSGQYIGDKRSNLGGGWEWYNRGATGSDLIHALQVTYSAKGWYKGKIDRFAGPAFWKAFKKANGGVTRKAQITNFQKNLNAGRLHKK